MQGIEVFRIIEIHGNLYFILSENFEKKIAVLSGKMRIQNQEKEIPYRNPVCVGDFVLVQKKDSNHSNEYPLIKEILPRKNQLIRATPTEIHLLGSNIDYAVCIVSFVEPELRTGFIDRFLISCFSGNIKPILFFTKCDLIKSNSDLHKEFINISLYYKKILKNIFWDNLLEPGNYKEFSFILKELTEEKISGFNEFREKIQKGTVLFVGQSGTGKSTLINLVMENPIQRTGSVSNTTKKGRHTTTTSTLFYKNSELFFIDTPGIKEWGLNHLSKKEIYESYPEFKYLSGSCKFKNCTHLPNIEGCAIQEEIRKGILPLWRKENIESIIKSLDYYERIRPGDYKKSSGRFHNRF